MSTSRANIFVTEIRAANRMVWEGLNILVARQREWNALDYGNTLPDGIGENVGLTKAEVGAVVFDSANALVTTLNTGVATNMAKLL